MALFHYWNHSHVKTPDFLLPTLKRGGSVWEKSCILIYKQQSIDINNLRWWQGYILYNSIILPPLLENHFFSLEDPQLKPKGWENIWIWNLSKCILDHFIIPVPPSYHFPHILLFNMFSLLASSAGGIGSRGRGVPFSWVRKFSILEPL